MMLYSMLRMRRLRNGLLVGSALLLPCGVVRGGIDPESNTDGINPAAELYEIAKMRRWQYLEAQRDLDCPHGPLLIDPAGLPVADELPPTSHDLVPRDVEPLPEPQGPHF